MTIKHCPLLGKQGAVTIVCRSGRKAPVRRGLEHELGFGGWPHPAAVPLSSLPPEYYQAFLSILVYRTRYGVRGNSGHAPAGVTALEAWAARIFLVAGVPFPRIGSGLIRAFSWGLLFISDGRPHGLRQKIRPFLHNAAVRCFEEIAGSCTTCTYLLALGYGPRTISAAGCCDALFRPPAQFLTLDLSPCGTAGRSPASSCNTASLSPCMYLPGPSM